MQRGDDVFERLPAELGDAGHRVPARDELKDDQRARVQARDARSVQADACGFGPADKALGVSIDHRFHTETASDGAMEAAVSSRLPSGTGEDRVRRGPMEDWSSQRGDLDNGERHGGMVDAAPAARPAGSWAPGRAPPAP